MIGIDYQKRKNTPLFESLESHGFTNVQNYIPIYSRFFALNENNYNNINLNHQWYLSNIKDATPENNVYSCNVKNVDSTKSRNKNVFFKQAPLLDPFKYLVGKYNPKDPKLFNLPCINSDSINVNSKFLDVNNSSYVDSFFSFLNSKLIHEHKFIHAVDFYGSFLSIKKDFTLNIFDDIDYLSKSDYFNKNKNVLFQVDDYNFMLDNDVDEKIKLPPIKIDHKTSANSIMSADSFDDKIYEDIFSETIVSLDTLKDKDIELEDVVDVKINSAISTTLKSGSTCSSRSSHTDKNGQDEFSDFENNEDIPARETDYISESDHDSNYETETESDASEEKVNAVIPKFPVQIICMEQCEDTFDNLILEEELSELEWYSAFMQIIMILITYQKMFAFTHNDLHTNNVMYNTTNQEYIYYCYKKKYYKVPTFGRVFKIIDFGRSIYKYNGQVFCSDSFQQGGDAATQYNTEPYFNSKKPRLEPNYSFDLCRLACSIFDYMVDDISSIKDLDTCDPVVKLIVEWCLDDNGTNLLYKNDGSDRYPDFKLYKMIARHVHNHTPQAQLDRSQFNAFNINKNKVPENATLINIDAYPCCV